MKCTVIIILIMLIMGCSDQPVSSVEFRLAKRTSSAGSQQYKMVNTKEILYLNEEVLMSNENFESAKVIMLRDKPVIEVTLNSNGKEQFAEITGANIGSQLGMVIDGKLFSAPKILAQVKKGILQIDGLLSREEAELISKQIIKEN